MVSKEWFPKLPDDFEESVRIDREEKDERDHRRQAIESYHVTGDSRHFIEDFIDRLLGQTDDMRTGSNYWLYGYYGSGKSHLLTVMDGLMNTTWLEDHDDVWDSLIPEPDELDGENDIDEVRRRWERVHEEYHVIPISVNLLKYQGQKQRSFSEIVLRHAHQNPILTGVHNGVSEGLSSQLNVAYFEDWYRTTDSWSDRQQHAETVINDLTPDSPSYDWDEDDLWTDIQQYSALADVVLPALFEDVTGTRDGYTDLQPSNIDPEEVVSRLDIAVLERHPVEVKREVTETVLREVLNLVRLCERACLFKRLIQDVVARRVGIQFIVLE